MRLRILVWGDRLKMVNNCARGYRVANTFEFDEAKGAEENILDFLTYVESIQPVFGPLLRRNLGKILPLPDASARSVARSSFNLEIKRLLELALAASKKKND